MSLKLHSRCHLKIVTEISTGYRIITSSCSCNSETFTDGTMTKKSIQVVFKKLPQNDRKEIRNILYCSLVQILLPEKF